MPTTVVEPERESLSIVVLGNFNPAIFQPLWFSANNLLPEEETEAAEVTVIQKQISIFSVGKIHVEVDESRLALTTDESPQGPFLRDLVAGTLSTLEHTPLTAIGLNLDMAFRLNSEDDWHALGDRLVPKQSWESFLERPGMHQLVVEGKRRGCVADRLQFRIQPSAAPTVLVAVNQHYQLETPSRKEVRKRHLEAIRVLTDDWPSFPSFARESASELLQSKSMEMGNRS